MLGIAVNDLGAPAADVEHDHRRGQLAETAERADEGEPCLLFSADDPCLHPERLLHVCGHLGATVGIAHRARPHDGDLVDPRVAQPCRVDVEAGVGARDGLGGERARLVDPLPEPCDGRLLVDRHELSALACLGDEKQDRVGADVDRRDAHVHTLAPSLPRYKRKTGHLAEAPRPHSKLAHDEVKAQRFAAQRITCPERCR